ncbi:MAG: hypothetical protein V9F03_14305, partial [Microthrixaceae bacterium]
MQTLLPELDVHAFKELDDRRRSAARSWSFAEALGWTDRIGRRTVLSVGEDFMLLSSACFGGGRDRGDPRVGLDLILPLAAMES